MFSKSVLSATAALSLIASTSAVYDANAKTNLAMYWGQGPNQISLLSFCQNTPADILIVGFINDFPPAANGLVGQNFGNACAGPDTNYKGPGYNPATSSSPGKITAGNDLLPGICARVQDGIPKCQALGKKMLLSLGGAVDAASTYVGQLKNAKDGEYFANFLWNAYGPYNASWTGVRPLDRGWDNKNANIKIDIDGFDFDIEGTVGGTNKAIGETAAYIALIKKLRALMDAQTLRTGKKYLITGTPQCTFNSAGKEANMDAMIFDAGFDILFIQFYNQGSASCTARSRANKVGSFNWVAWVSYIAKAGSASNKAKLYIGLLGGPTGGTKTDYLNVAEVQNLIKTYGFQPKFGGVMLWDATAAYVNLAADLPKTSTGAVKKYWTVVKEAMLKNYPPKTTRRSHLSHMQRHKHLE